MTIHRAYVVCVAIVLGVSSGEGAFESNQAGPRSLALGNASIPLGGGVWNCFENPAGLAQPHRTGAGFFYQPGLFGLPELATFGAGVSTRVGDVGVAVHAVSFGCALYRETTMGLACGRGIAGTLALGLRARMQRLSIQGYGSAMAIVLDVGARVQCSDMIALAATFDNVASSQLGRTGESLPQQLTCGMMYTPAIPVRLFLSTRKEMLSPLEVHCGIEVEVAEPLTVRFGAIDNPTIVSFGLAVCVTSLTMEYGCSYHWVLGATHEIGITVAIP
jgi:hypothetical protein